MKQVLLEDSEWTLVADDWGYHLWHDPDTWPTLTTLAEQHEVFWCAVGDIDGSFEFAHLRAEVAVREYRVDHAGLVTSDVGTPLACEVDGGTPKVDVLDYVLDLAESLEIVAHRALESLRVYTHPVHANRD